MTARHRPPEPQLAGRRTSPARVAPYVDELVAFRRDLHAHPELSWAEVRTTRLVRERLQAAGLDPQVLPGRHRPDLRHRRRATPLSRCAPTSTPCRSSTARRSPTRRRCPACATPAGTTCTRRPCSAPGWCSPTWLAKGGCRAGPAGLPARRGVLAQRCARRGGRRRRRPAWSGSSPCTATRGRRGPGRAPGRRDHRLRRPPARAGRADRAGTPRGRTSRRTWSMPWASSSPSSGRAVAPDRPACVAEPGLGPHRRRPGRERDPAGR